MSPFDSFFILKLFPFDLFLFNSYFDLSFTISTLLLCFVSFSYFYFFKSFSYLKYFNFFFLIFNHFYHFFKSTFNLQFLPYIFVTFFFILFSNLLGLIPYSFTITSQFVITFLLSFSNIFAITLFGLILHRFNFFKLFLPKDLHFSLIPFICFIEVISYLSRIISLSIRLSANLISGHVILIILSSIGLFILPLLFFILLLEIVVAFIQAYVFSVLISIYLVDVINIHLH